MERVGSLVRLVAWVRTLPACPSWERAKLYSNWRIIKLGHASSVPVLGEDQIVFELANHQIGARWKRAYPGPVSLQDQERSGILSSRHRFTVRFTIPENCHATSIFVRACSHLTPGSHLPWAGSCYAPPPSAGRTCGPKRGCDS